MIFNSVQLLIYNVLTLYLKVYLFCYRNIYDIFYKFNTLCDV